MENLIKYGLNSQIYMFIVCVAVFVCHVSCMVLHIGICTGRLHTNVVIVSLSMPMSKHCLITYVYVAIQVPAEHCVLVIVNNVSDACNCFYRYSYI